MNLGLSNVGSTMYLDWDEYEDESGVFMPDQYLIYRGTSTTNMTLFDSISSSFTSWNDINVFDVYYYMVGVSKTDPCDVTGTKNAFSNKKNNQSLITAMHEMGYLPLSIYPNPFTTKTTIEFNNPSNNTYILTITDITGRVVETIKEITGSKVEVERNGLAVGVYAVKLSCNNGGDVFRGRIVVE